MNNIIIEQLWRSLSGRLGHIFDAHTVCSIVATELTKKTELISLIGLRSERNQYYDLWLAIPGRQVRQMRWPDDRLDTVWEQTGGEQFGWSEALQNAFKMAELPLFEAEHVVSASLTSSVLYNTAALGAICLMPIDQDAPIITGADLCELALFVNVYLDRAFLRYRADQQEVEFSIVQQIGLSLAAAMSLEEVFLLVSDIIRRTMHVETISIALIDEETEEIVFVPTLMSEEFQQLPALRLQKGEGVAGWAINRAESVMVNNVRLDSRFYRYADEVSGFHTRSLLAVPIRGEQRIVGVLEAINKQDGDFAETDLRLLEIIVAALGIAISNASLHQEVLSEKKRMEVIFDNMAEGIMILNRDGIITECNEALLSLLRCSRDAIINKHYKDIILTQENKFDQFVTPLLKQNFSEMQNSCYILRQDIDPLPVLVSVSPIVQDDQLEELVFAFSDLSEIRELERMRDDLFHNIVHELRTPLATILLYARLLRDETVSKNREKYERFIETIESESNRLQQMVKEMLLLAKLEAREMQRTQFTQVNVKKMIEEIYRQMSVKAEKKGVKFSLSIEDELPLIFAQRELLYRIFKNLIENGVKFTPQQGSVSLFVKKENSGIEFSITDTGIGIPKEAKPNLYQRFYRTSTAIEKGIGGTGLGLYLVKEGIDAHNGTITLESELGVGTTFTVWLPIEVVKEE